MSQFFTNAVIFHTDEDGNKIPVGQVSNILEVEAQPAKNKWGEEYTTPQPVADVALEVTSKDGWSTSKTIHPDYDARATLERRLKEIEPTVRATTDGDFIVVHNVVFEVVGGKCVQQAEGAFVSMGFSETVVSGPKVIKTGTSAA